MASRLILNIRATAARQLEFRSEMELSIMYDYRLEAERNRPTTDPIIFATDSYLS